MDSTSEEQGDAATASAAGPAAKLASEFLEGAACGPLRWTASDPLAFSFEYFGIQFSGAATRRDDKGLLTLSADLGPLPYTSQSREARTLAQAIIAAANKRDRPVLELSSRQHILMTGEVSVDLPFTVTSLLVGVTELVLSVKPCLDMLAMPLTAVQPGG